MKTSTMIRAMALGAVLGLGAPPVAHGSSSSLLQDLPSQYERARQALNQAEYARAVELFRTFRRSEPESRNIAESLYWEAFALSRMETTANLRGALDVLRMQEEQYAAAASAEEARALKARVHGELASRGDEESARWVYEHTVEDAGDRGRASRGGSGGNARQDQQARSDETKIAALQALMNMDSEAALPILRRVVRDRDNNPELRTQALFILSQHEAPDVSDLMLDVARNDPSSEVRETAVFWLSRVDADEAIPVLQSILESSADARLHESALFAIAQMNDPRARQIIRDFARSSSATPEQRASAIFQLGQSRSPEDAAFLREMWSDTSEPQVRESIMFALSHMNEDGNAEWLMSVALDPSENVEVRKQALFAASQHKDVKAADVARIFDQAQDRDLKQQALFILSQSKDPVAFDKIVEVIRSDTDSELRQNAIFWLGQSGDSRAESVLIEILEN